MAQTPPAHLRPRGQGREGAAGPEAHGPRCIPRNHQPGPSPYNSTCGYCHGDRGKGGKAGPDLIASLVTLHDEDGVEIGSLCEKRHSKVVEIDSTDAEIGRYSGLSAFARGLCLGRGEVHL